MSAEHEKIGAEIREYRLARELSQTKLAVEFNVVQTTISAWERGKITEMRNPELVARALGYELGDFLVKIGREAIEKGERKRMSPVTRAAVEASINSKSIKNTVVDVPAAGTRDVPVYGRVVGGSDGRYEFNGETMGWETRPTQLIGVSDGYAVYADGESMYPRYKPGETIWINPHKIARPGEDVVVQIHSDDDGPPYGFIKEFVGWRGNRLVLKQFNPPTEIEFDRDEVASVHLVVLSGRT